VRGVRRPPVAAGYLVGVLGLLLAAAAKTWLAGVGTDISYLAFWPAITLGAWLGGAGAGLTVTILAAAVDTFLFTRPTGGPLTISASDTIPLLGFVAGGVLVSIVTGRLRHAIRDAADAAAERGRALDAEHRARQQAEAAVSQMRRSRDQLDAVLGSVGDGIVVEGPEGRLVYANPPAARIFGFPSPEALVSARPEEVAARFEIMDASGARLPIDRLPGRIALKDGHREESLLRFRVPATGDERWAYVRATPVPGPDGNSRQVVNTFRDVTDEQASQEARDAFIGLLSHELRTPITTIYGGSRLLDRALSDERRHDIIEDIQADADRLYRLVEDLLVMTRVERGGVEIGDEPVLIQRILPAVARSEEARWPGLRISLALPERLPAVRGDSTYVEQVVRNLVGNAAKYAGTDTPVRIVADEAVDAVCVRVLDRGPGIGADEPDRLFELFHRGASSNRAGGAGIGLFVCRALIAAMGGRIWALPRPDGGAEFGFSLPVLEPDGAE
jgi:PAS domain S-box-containing protein